MKVKVLKAIFIVLFILLLGSTGYLFYQKTVVIGDIKYREHLISAVSMKLAEKGYKSNDIKKIGVEHNYFKGGVIPYDVYVVFKKDPSNTYYYNWENKQKKKIVLEGKNDF